MFSCRLDPPWGSQGIQLHRLKGPGFELQPMNLKKTPCFRRLPLLILAFAGIARWADAVDMKFDSYSVTPDGTYSNLGSYYSGTTMDFYNVGSLEGKFLDMRVSVAFSGNYGSIGILPNYSQTIAGEPAGDLGVLYQANGAGVGGATYTLSFFDHDSNFTTPFVVPAMSMMIYDVDGESFQSESVRAFMSDGFVSYNLGTAPAHLVAAPEADSYVFNGPGYNTAETDPTAAVILNFENTSSIRFSFESSTLDSSPLPNPIFSGIDGDLSMLKGDLTGFTDAIPVPEPSGALLIMASLAGWLLRRRRRVAE